MKETWKTINLLLNKRSKTTNIKSLKVDDQFIVDNTEIAQSMNKFFCSVGEKLSDHIPQQPNPMLSNEYVVNQPSTQFRFEAVSPVGAERSLMKMKISFRFGSDGIASHFLKIAFPAISSSLCRIYNLSMETGVFPDSWKEARVAPIFKSGNADDCSNYRPKSVLTVLSRLFEKLIYGQQYKYLVSNKHLYSDQNSFRHLHSVVSCLLKCTNDWYFNIDRGK